MPLKFETRKEIKITPFFFFVEPLSYLIITINMFKLFSLKQQQADDKSVSSTTNSSLKKSSPAQLRMMKGK